MSGLLLRWDVGTRNESWSCCCTWKAHPASPISPGELLKVRYDILNLGAVFACERVPSGLECSLGLGGSRESSCFVFTQCKGEVGEPNNQKKKKILLRLAKN